MHLLFTKWMNSILIFSHLFRGMPISLSILTPFRSLKRFPYKKTTFTRTKSHLFWILCNGVIKINLEGARKDKLVLIFQTAPLLNQITTCMKYTVIKIALSQTFKMPFQILIKVQCLKQFLIGHYNLILTIVDTLVLIREPTIIQITNLRTILLIKKLCQLAWSARTLEILLKVLSVTLQR